MKLLIAHNVDSRQESCEFVYKYKYRPEKKLSEISEMNMGLFTGS